MAKCKCPLVLLYLCPIRIWPDKNTLWPEAKVIVVLFLSVLGAVPRATHRRINAIFMNVIARDIFHLRGRENNVYNYHEED